MPSLKMRSANLFGGGGVVLSEPAVIGHSCCGVPANFLSVCLFVCLFFGEANKIKIKWNETRQEIPVFSLYLEALLCIITKSMA